MSLRRKEQEQAKCVSLRRRRRIAFSFLPIHHRFAIYQVLFPCTVFPPPLLSSNPMADFGPYLDQRRMTTLALPPTAMSKHGEPPASLRLQAIRWTSMTSSTRSIPLLPPSDNLPRPSHRHRAMQLPLPSLSRHLEITHPRHLGISFLHLCRTLRRSGRRTQNSTTFRDESGRPASMKERYSFNDIFLQLHWRYRHIWLTLAW